MAEEELKRLAEAAEEAQRARKALAEVRSALGLELRKLQERANVQEAKIATLTATVERLRAESEGARKAQGSLARQLRDAQARADRLSVELLKSESPAARPCGYCNGTGDIDHA